MKYGESIFDIIYLIFAIAMGVCILHRKSDTSGRLMGSATLILGCGDAFHLIPRVLNYFVDAEFTVWLGAGKLVTSISMTVFYLLMYRLWLVLYEEREDRKLRIVVYVLTAVRILLCLLPQNGWFQNDSSVLWGIVRNVPFVVLGGIIVWLFWERKEDRRCFRYVWLLVLLSFLFYIPVAVAAGLVPILGMLMLPKTVCYMLLIWCFWRYASGENAS
jgi:hypothetical protein